MADLVGASRPADLSDFETFPDEASRMGEQRSKHRNGTLKGATIDFGIGTFDCIVRNLTDRGAMLETASPFGLPDRFRLIIPSDQLQKPCRVVWRRGQRLGVIFVAS